MSIIVSTLYDCYDYVIGLYKGTCDCFDPKGDYALDYNTSLSGLYLNKLVPLNTLKGLENCENSDLWTFMYEAREQAIINFVADTNAALSKNYKLRYRPFSGIIGRIENKNDRNITTDHAGLILRCNPVKSGTMTIRSIGTLFNFTGTIQVTIYDSLNTNHGTYTLNTTEDTYVENDIVELELPLYSEYIDNIEYFIIYSLGVNQPRDNDLSCYCGSFRPYYSLQMPYYTKMKPAVYGWANYVMVGGIETDDLDFMEHSLSVSRYMNGLTLRAEFRCNVGETLCKDELDFTGDPLSGAIAHAILYKSAFLLADSILNSDKINRFIMMKHDQLIEFQKEWVEKYSNMIEYIVENVDISKSDCFICRESYGINRAGILA